MEDVEVAKSAPPLAHQSTVDQAAKLEKVLHYGSVIFQYISQNDELIMIW